MRRVIGLCSELLTILTIGTCRMLPTFIKRQNDPEKPQKDVEGFVEFSVLYAFGLCARQKHESLSFWHHCHGLLNSCPSF